MQAKYEQAMGALSEMEKRAIMAETMLEATLQYQSGQVKAHQPFSSRYSYLINRFFFLILHQCMMNFDLGFNHS